MSSVASANERLQRLEQLVPLCAQIRQGTEYGAALAQAAGEVRKVAALPDRLESLEPALRVLQGTQHLPVDDLLPDLKKLEAAGRSLEKSVNAEALKDARFSVKDIQEALQRVEALVSKAWVARVQAEFSPLERLGTVLAGIPDTKQAGIALQRWATRALGVSGSGAPTADSVKHFGAVQAELPGRLEALGKLGIDAAVRAFLLEVAGERATLASMTPEVLEWLQAKKAQSRFRIKLI
jgi:hypothetical protein